MSDLLIIPFAQTYHDGKTSPGGALIAVGRSASSRKKDDIRQVASALSREMERAVSAEARRHQQNAELEAKRMTDWMCFCFGSAHAFKNQEAAYLDILQRAEQFLDDGGSSAQILIKELNYIRASTIERTEFFNFLIWLSRILTQKNHESVIHHPRLTMGNH